MSQLTKPINLESRIENIEKELFVIKLALRKQKNKKIKLAELISKIHTKTRRDVNTTSLIRQMRERNYA